MPQPDAPSHKKGFTTRNNNEDEAIATAVGTSLFMFFCALYPIDFGKAVGEALFHKRSIAVERGVESSKDVGCTGRIFRFFRSVLLQPRRKNNIRGQS
jgi:hypothetical protein